MFTLFDQSARWIRGPWNRGGHGLPPLLLPEKL